MTYAVVYVEAATQRVEWVMGRGMQFHTADRLAASMQPRARDGMCFKAINERDLNARPVNSPQTGASAS